LNPASRPGSYVHTIENNSILARRTADSDQAAATQTAHEFGGERWCCSQGCETFVDDNSKTSANRPFPLLSKRIKTKNENE
jgi:hypothetical protein